MKNSFTQKTLLVLILFVGLIVNAQHSQNTPPPPVKDIGAPSTVPIDMYVIWLLISAVSLIVYFNYQRRIINNNKVG